MEMENGGWWRARFSVLGFPLTYTSLTFISEKTETFPKAGFTIKKKHTTTKKNPPQIPAVAAEVSTQQEARSDNTGNPFR